MSNLKHLIMLACFLVGGSFAFGQTLTITPSSGTYSPNGTQAFIFEISGASAGCFDDWTVNASSSSNYQGFSGQNIGDIISVPDAVSGTVEIIFNTPPSGTLTINATATPPAVGGCTDGVLTATAVTLTAAEIPDVTSCDAAFTEGFQSVAIGAGLSGDMPPASATVGQGTAYIGDANFKEGSFFEVIDAFGDRRMEASNFQNGEVYWESDPITLSPCCSRDISVEIFGSGGQNPDYVRVYYKINTGTENLIGEGSGNFGTSTVSTSTCEIIPAIMETSTLRIIIRIATNSADELYGFDNVLVSAGTPVEAPQVLNISCSGDATNSTVTIDAVAECTAEFSFNGGAFSDVNNAVLASNMMYDFSVRDATFQECGIASGTVFIDASGDCDFVLPITLLDFYGRAEADAIALYWTTSTELNNDYMAVERSLNGIDFEEIGRVEGRGTTSEQQQYTFVDNYPIAGTNYYRLRQVDYDGTEEYHPVISVLFDKPLAFGMNISPNPVREILQVDWSLPETQDGILRVFDMQGQLMSQRAIAQGSGRYNLPTRDLPAGFYILQMEQGGQTQTLRFVKE